MGEGDNDSQYGNLSVKLDAAKRIYSHCCRVKGNLLTLIHGLETHRPPDGGRLRGQQFKDAVAKLKEINGDADSPTPQSSRPAKSSIDQTKKPPETSRAPSVRSDEKVQPPFNVNIPLHRHENEAARKLADLHKDLLTDISQMSPEAAAFVRQRDHWLTPELMQKWSCGWIPGNGRSHTLMTRHGFAQRNTARQPEHVQREQILCA